RGKGVRVGGEAAAFAGRDLFVRIEAKARDIRPASDGAILDGSAEGMAGVINQKQIMRSAYLSHAGPSDGEAENVYRQNGFGGSRDGAGHRIGGKVVGRGVDIHEAKANVFVEQDVGGRHKAKRRRDHLVGGAQAEAEKS